MGFPCPSYEIMKEAIQKKIGLDIEIIEYTH